MKHTKEFRQRRVELKQIQTLISMNKASEIKVAGRRLLRVDLNPFDNYVFDGRCNRCKAITDLWDIKYKRWTCTNHIRSNKGSESGKRYRYKLSKVNCEQCGLKEWRGAPITLHIHHVDKNHENNEISNLRVLCPNCHAAEHSMKSNSCKNEVAAARLSDF